jgi:cytochrome P450
VLGLHERYGEVVRTGPRELSYITETAFTEIHGNKTRAEDVYEKNPVVYLQGSGKITNIFFARHKEHVRYRKLMSPAFSEAAIREQEPLIRSFVDTFILSMRNRSGIAYYPDQDGIVDLAAWYSFIVFDLLSSLAFGASVGSLEKGDYHPWVRVIYGAIKDSTFIQAAHRLNPYGKLLERLIPGGVDGAYEEHMDFSRRTLAERQKMTQLARSDFFSFFEKGMDPEELLDNVNILVTAGGETTATTLASITYYLTHNPSSYGKLIREIRETFEKEEEITIPEVQKLKYLKAVIEENFRIHPPIPVGLPRVVPKGGRFIDGKFVPGGVSHSHLYWISRVHSQADLKLKTWVSVSSLACCRMSEYFRDPELFIPERWMGGSEFDSDYREVIHPFLIGSRSCIASRYVDFTLLTGCPPIPK